MGDSTGYTPRDTTVVVGDMRLAVTEWGGAGETVFFSHPTGFFGKIWRLTINSLRELGFSGRIVTYDQRGQGMSAKPDSGYEWSNLVADTSELVEALGIRDAVGVGHSGGATTIGCVAAAVPTAFRRVVLIDPILVGSFAHLDATKVGNSRMAAKTRTRRTIFDSREQFFDHLRARPPYDSWLPEALRVYAADGTFDRPDGHVELLCPGRIESQLYDGALDVDPLTAFAELRIPALLVGAENSDSFRGDRVDAARKALHDHRYLEIEKATHFVPMEYPRRVAELILAELRA